MIAMRARRPTLFAIVAVGSVGACNALLGNESAIDYVDGAALAPPRDVATDDQTSSSSDGEIEDAGADRLDALSIPDTEVSCSAASFCADFDPPSNAEPWGFTSSFPMGGSGFAIESTDSVTAPNSLRITVDASSSTHAVGQTIDAGRPFTTMFDVRVRARSGFVNLLQVTCRIATVINVNVDATGRIVLTNGSSSSTGPTLPLDQWVRMVLTITPTSTTLYALGAASTPMSLDSSCLGPFGIKLGLTAFSAPWTVLFDRVRVTAP